MKKFCYSLLLAASFFLLFQSVYSEKLTILYLSDTHSNLDPGGSRDSELNATKGGIARLATLIGMEKSGNPEALFLHGGDFSIGDLLYCKYFGVPELQILKSIGCDAVELGNHEFDLTPAGLLQVLQAGYQDGAIPTLCANANFTDPAVTELGSLIQPFKVFERNGIKIGIFGLVTPSTVELSNPSPVGIYDDITTLETAALMVDTLKKQGCKVIVLLSHLGYLYDYNIAGMVPGIDLILGSHDHITLPEAVEVENPGGTKTRIIHAGAFYEYVARIVLDTDGYNTKLDSYTLIPLDDKIPEEPTTKAVIENLKDNMEETYGQPFFSLKIAECERDLEEFAADAIKEGRHDTEVGNLVADAFWAWGQTDIAITATGFTSHKLYKGPIVAADIYRMMGYGFNEENGLGFRMVKFKIKGIDLIKGISFGLSQLFYSEDFLILAAGMDYKYEMFSNNFELNGNYASFISANVSGQPIDPEKTYSVTTQEGILAFLGLLEINVEDLEYGEDNITEFMVVSGYCSQIQNITSNVQGRVECVKVTTVNESNPIELKTVFPTPCDNKATIYPDIKNPGNYHLSIYNSQGNIALVEKIHFSTTGITPIEINTSGIIPGIYSFVLNCGNDSVAGKLIIVR